MLAFGVIALVCGLRLLQLDFFERLECMTYDARVRLAAHSHPSTATNLAFLYINEESIRRVWDGSLGYHFGLLWPRQVYGAVVNELAQQKAKAVAFDILFGELRSDQPSVRMADGASYEESDDFFAHAMQRAGNVLLASTPEIVPPELFLTNAMALGDIAADRDSDGILRRCKAFRVYRHWHEAFRQLESDPDYAVDLRAVRILPHELVLPRPRELGDIRVPLDNDGNFDLADFWGDQLKIGAPRKAKPFKDEIIWQMGLVLAARELNLDLSRARLELPHGRIVLSGPGGLECIIPVDRDGYFYIDWALPEGGVELTEQPIQDLLAQYRRRLQGDTNAIIAPFAGKLVIVGSRAVIGNNLTDRGATPLSADTVLVSKHWNVANSVITGRFVRRASLPIELALIAVLGVFAALITWRMRVLSAACLVAIILAGYCAGATVLFLETRYWLPVVLPVCGALLMTHICLVTWRVVFEQAERRRIRSFFSTLVSPKIVQELLQTEKLSLGGVRREITVLFADVRGFTEFTDSSAEQVADWVRRNQLTGDAADACFEQQARETLETINQYLGLVAHTIIRREGTLDKFIGDCVMAFWGAPTTNPRHAVDAVRAAIDAQRAIENFNQQRAAENLAREAENRDRAQTGLPARPALPLLYLGTGINTGMATVGLMGAEAGAAVRQGNYTVFGREVNVASRLESASGRGRIFISRSTYDQLLRFEPDLAATCVALPAIQVKGIRTAVEVFEVPWRMPEAPEPASVNLGRSSVVVFPEREPGNPTATQPADTARP